MAYTEPSTATTGLTGAGTELNLKCGKNKEAFSQIRYRRAKFVCAAFVPLNEDIDANGTLFVLRE